MSQEPISDEAYTMFEHYLSNKMDAESRTQFELQLVQYPHLKAAYEDYQEILAALAGEPQIDVMRKKVAEWQAKVEKETLTRAVGREKTSRLRPITWAIAASIAILFVVGGYWLFSPSKNERLFAQYFEADPRSNYTLGTAQDAAIQKGMAAYQSKDFALASQQFTLALQAQPTNDTLRYFNANALLALQDADAAILVFRALARDTNSPFAQTSNWYLALALIQQGDLVPAKSIVQSIAINPLHPMQTSAQQLLPELE